jgi:hypothetical protein
MDGLVPDELSHTVNSVKPEPEIPSIRTFSWSHSLCDFIKNKNSMTD